MSKRLTIWEQLTLKQKKLYLEYQDKYPLTAKELKARLKEVFHVFDLTVNEGMTLMSVLKKSPNFQVYDLLKTIDKK